MNYKNNQKQFSSFSTSVPTILAIEETKKIQTIQYNVNDWVIAIPQKQNRIIGNSIKILQNTMSIYNNVNIKSQNYKELIAI